MEIKYSDLRWNDNGWEVNMGYPAGYISLNDALTELTEYRRQIESGELVRVVSCGECKYADPLYASNSPVQIGYACQNSDEKTTEKDFCSYGERREKE